MKRMVMMLSALICAAVACFGQQQMPALPNDPATRVGKLDNGMTYYIRHNDKPANRAEFYLATNVGAIQETPDQDGLAHFLEHMCFNGTKNFPGKGILNWLESIGASFGGNVNASTGVEQTIYLLNNIPLIRPTVVDTCILIMHDYSHFVTCDPAEIDAERGVILEEKRTRNTASWRMFEQSAKYYYGDTKYSGCTVIGSEENLKTFKPESLTNFYHTWYVPTNQALIVVGDIDVDHVEQIIKSTFADIPAPENPKAKDVIMIPENKEPIVGILTDPENSNNSISILWKSEPLPREYRNTAMGFMADILKSVTGNIMNERLEEIAAQPDAPFVGAGFGMGGLCNTCDVTQGQVAGKDGKDLEAFKVLCTEIEKMHRFGFTDDEIERAKADILSRYESRSKKADTRKNGEFVYPMIYNFFDNESFMDPATEYQVAQMLMPQIQNAAINQFAQSQITDENVIILFKGIAKEGKTVPSEEELLSVYNSVKASEIEAPKAAEIPSQFLDPSTLKGSAVKSEKATIAGATEWVLKNGVKVILLPTEYEKDRINVELYKKGGLSIISTEDMPSFESNIWQLYQSNAGVGEFSATTIQKMRSGKNFSWYPFINSTTHGVTINSSVKDIEMALQLFYLQFTQPRFDENEYNQGINQIKTVLPNLESQPNYKLQQEVYKTLYNNPRKLFISQEVLDKANLQTLERVVKTQLFNDAAGAIVTVVGDFKIEEIKPLIEKYVGSLPKGKKTTDWKNNNDGVVAGFITDDFKAKMETPKTTVLQVWSVNKPYSVEQEVALSAIRYILNMTYTETLREQEGGTYGASVATQAGVKPNEKQIVQVSFDTNVDAADKLRDLAKDGLIKLAENGPSAEMFDKTVKNFEKTMPERRIQNSYWVSCIHNWTKFGIDYDKEMEAAIKSLTPEKIKAAANDIVKSGNFIEVIMRPEE